MEPIRIVVPYNVGLITPNTRIHWRERHRRNQDAAAAARLAWIAAGRPEAPGRVRVSLIVRRGRRLDPDALLASAKPILDALLCRKRNNGEGIVDDDSAHFVEFGFAHQTTGKPWKGKETVEVIVEPIEEAQSE